MYCCNYSVIVLWTLFIILFLFKTHNILETGFCLLLQVDPSQLGPINRASTYLQTPAPTQDRVYKQAQHKSSEGVKTNLKTLNNFTHMRPNTYVHALFHGVCC
jgi:hypothetical protein